MADTKREGEESAEGAPRRALQQPPAAEELVDTGVNIPASKDDDIDRLTRDEVEDDPGEATRKLPKNDQAL